MPQADPAQWREARIAWEVDPEMTLRDVARRLNVSAPVVTIRAKRELWVKSDVVDVERLTYTPKQLVEIAARALVRACVQTKDHATAIKAAGMLLDRTMGRISAEQSVPMLPPAELPGGVDPDQFPDWVKQRYIPPVDGLPEDREAPDPAPPLTQSQIAPPAQLRDPAPAPAEPQSAPTPRFWDAPGRPALDS